jgi:hypothetical protein
MRPAHFTRADFTRSMPRQFRMEKNVTKLFDSVRRLTPDDSSPLPDELFAKLSQEVAEAAVRDGLVVPENGLENGRYKPYPMLPSIVQLTAAAEEHLAEQLPHIVSAWQTLLTAHRTDIRVRDFLAVPSVLREWVDAADIEDYRVDFCRFDLVGGDVATARIVEFNANCPGGVIFTSAYSAWWRKVPQVAEILQEWGVRPSPLDDRLWFPRFFADATGRDRNGSGAEGRGPVAIFHKPGGNVLELDKMADLFAEVGRHSVLVNPAVDDWLDQEVWTGYLKYGIQAVLADIGGWAPFLERISSGKMRIVNPLPGRWIGDNKLCLAALSDPRFGDLFTLRQREAIEFLIPFSRKAGDGIDPSQLLSERAEWVLKGPYDTRGNSVFVGSEQDPRQWQAVVRRAVDQGWLAQEAVPPGRRTWHGVPGYQDLSIVLLGGNWAGYTSRISENLRVNVAQGGGRQVVFGHLATEWVKYAG